MLPRKPLMKKTVGTAGGASSIRSQLTGNAGVKRQNQTGPSNPGIKKQRLEFPKQGVAGSSTGPSPTTSSFTRLVELDVSWMDAAKDVSITASEFQVMLDQNRAVGKAPKAICALIKSLLKTDDGASMDFDLFKQVIKTIPKDADVKKAQSVCEAVFTLLNKVETQAALMNCSIVPVALDIINSLDYWPSSFLNHVLYDSLGTRNWIDKQEATAIALAAFSLFGEVIIPSEDMFQSISDQVSFIKNVIREPPKYQLTSEQKTTLYKTTYEYVEKSIDIGSSKPLIRTLCLLCADDKFRLLAAQKLEPWLLNSKYQRHAMELILFISCNIRNLDSKVNFEILSLLSKIRLQKSKQVQNVLQRGIREIVANCPESLSIFTEFIVENDFHSSSKAQSNIVFLQFLFKQNSTEVLRLIANRLIKRLENPDQIKHVRLFVREFNRSLTSTPFSHFSLALFDTMKTYVKHNSNIQVMVFRSCVEVACTLPFLSINNTVRDAAQSKRSSANLSNIQNDALNRFQQHLQQFELEAVSAIRWAAVNFKLDSSVILESLYAVLYLHPFQFYSIDSWPTEADFNNFVRIISECPIDERLINTLIGTKVDILSASDILDLLTNLTTRTINCGIELDSGKGLSIKSADIVAKLFSLCQTNQGKNLAEHTLYWKSWELVFCWTCMNSQLLKNIYSLYPTLRMLFSMAISSDFNFPPIRFEEYSAEQTRNNDAEEREKELDAIKNIDQENGDDNSRPEVSNKTYCLLNPSGPARKPPSDFIIKLKHLNDQFSFSVNLCQITEPDILSRVCAYLSPQRILSTVISFLSTNSSQIEKIPLTCICQLFLLITCQQNSIPIDNHIYSTSKSSKTTTNGDLQELIFKIVQSYVKEKSKPVGKCKIAIEYLVSKLAASHSTERDAACIGLGKLLQYDPSSEFDPTLLSTVAHFSELKEDLCLLLATACTVEKRSSLITEYLKFIVENIDENSMNRIASRLSAIVERSNSGSDEHKKIRQNLVKFFADFMRKLIEGSSSRVSSNQLTSPSNTGDKLIVHLTYPTSKTIEIDSEILKAVMELLCETFGDYESGSSENKSRDYLMNIWFPSSKLKVTSVNDKSTAVEILPQSLKMKMLSAKDERIVKVALNDATPGQALNYIQTFGLSSFSCTELLRILNNSSTPKSEAARSAIPFVRAYKNCDGADEFLKSIPKNDEELKMEVDTNGPALFNPIQAPPSIFDSRDYEESKINAPETCEFNDVSSISKYLEKVIIDPGSKQMSFILSPNWTRFLKTLRSSIEMSKEAIKFSHERLLQIHREVPNVLYSVLSCVIYHSDSSFQAKLTALTDHIKSVLPGNLILLTLLKPCPRSSLKPVMTKESNDIDIDMQQRDSKENDKMHWAISEYFEAVMIPNNEDAKLLAKKLRIELTEIVRNNPTVFSRQLPLVFGHVQALLKLNNRQASELDSYSAILHVLQLVLTAGRNIFCHTQAFETFVEIFLNSMAASSKRSRQWESILDKLIVIMHNYLNWNPSLAIKLVERNKSALFHLRNRYSDFRLFTDFIKQFPQIFRFG